MGSRSKICVLAAMQVSFGRTTSSNIHEHMETVFMNWNHSLSRILGAAALAFAATSAYALPKGPCTDQKDPYAMPRGPCDPKPDACCEEARPGPFGFAYPMDVDLNCPRDFYVNVAGLAFQAKQDGMAFAIRNSNGVDLPITNGQVLNFSTDNHDWHYNPGIRVGLGFYVHHDAWNLEFDWTWINITDSKRFNGANSDVLIPLWIPPQALSTTWTTAAGVWNAHYNTLDAKLGKPYHVSRYLILNPHFGLRAGWIDQHFSAHYGGTYSFPYSGTVHHGDNDFWGFGARAGIKTDWVIGKGWNLFGNIAAALLFGKFEVDQNVTINDTNGYELTDDFYQNVPNMEIQLGIAWNKYFNKQKYRIQLAAAYEFHEWWNQFNMRRIYGNGTSIVQSDTVSRGDLTLNGFSLNLRFDI